MLIITITKNHEDLTYRNVVDFHIKEITYMQYEIEIVYSHFPYNGDKMIVDKDELNNITIFKD